MVRFHHFISLAGLAIAVLVFSSASAQTNDVTAEADSLYREAWDLQKQAEDLGNSREAHDVFSQTIAKCDMATRSRPDFFKAQALAAHCYYRLTQMHLPGDRHQDLMKAARDRFALAALCTGADAALYREWGGMLVGEATVTAQPVEREQLLRDARRVYEAGLIPNSLIGEHAKVERDLGTCLTILAQTIFDESDKKALFEEANDRFSSAAKIEAVSSTPQLYAHWGVTLVECSKLTGNRMLLHQAVERLETALEKGSEGSELLEVHYNLVCAYALLGLTGQAMQNLRFCLNHDDDKHSYFNAAARDPDLRSLEQVPEYSQIFSEKPGASVGTIVKPSLSDQ